MKRTIKIISVLSIIIILLMPNTCLANNEIDYKSKLNDYDLSSFELLDDDASNLLKDLGIDDFNYENISNISFNQVLKYIISIFSNKAQTPIKCCLILVCFVILSSIVKSFDMRLSGDSISELYATVSNLVIAIFLLSQIYDSVKFACSSIKICSNFTYAFFPVFCVICATSGGAMTSFSVNGSLLLLSQALNFISANVFLPVVNCFMGISVCSSIRRDLNMGSIVKNLITKSISALSAIFVSYLSLKTAVASRADALGLRSVRFAINSIVPIIGSSISEGLLSIQSYSSLIKTSVGIVGIIAIAAVFLPAIVNITLWRLSISVANICSKVFFDSESTTVFDAFLSVLLIINVLLILSMVTTIISLGILVASKTVNV